MAKTKNSMSHEGKVYYTVPCVARMLGTTTTKLKQIAEAEGLEFQNFRVNGRLWISAKSVDEYTRRQKAIKAKKPTVEQA